MAVILEKHAIKFRNLLRDVRPATVRMAEFWSSTDVVAITGIMISASVVMFPEAAVYSDLLLVCLYFYFRWFYKKPFCLPLKLPKGLKCTDSHNPKPGKGGSGPAEGIMFIGNLSDPPDPRLGQELWLTNTDARTHILFIGTTGSGKTEGLKSLVTNSLTWGSGFVYVDGKADTDLWASLYSLARRFGRDDDLLVLNYMTANSDDGAVSNTMNPFANGSASYLSNMVTSLMPDAGGDNAMWKERAVALLSALMPALTWKRDKQGLLLDVSILREYIELRPIVALSRDSNLPERIIRGLQGYLNTLPGFVDAAFDDEGNERPPSPDQPMYDLQVARQQHGYLSMQFTRSLQSLGDEYGYIFRAQLADIDVLDVVLNRRILVALIPALEKSGDEAANLGKIIAASLKGMMGATLGNTVEGAWEMAIGSKQTRSNSSFMTVFDEVGYYTAPGMAVMAAQARSLGFSLVFAAQDLPSMEKRVKQEAQSILANCNLKIFGKLEDPLETKDFLDKHAGSNLTMDMGAMSAPTNTLSSLFMTSPYVDNRGTTTASSRQRVSYDSLRAQREGEVHMFFAEYAIQARLFHAAPEKVKALRVHKMLPVPATTTATSARERAINELAARLKDPDWTAEGASSAVSSSSDVITAMAQALARAEKESGPRAGALAVVAASKVVPRKQEPQAEAPAAPVKNSENTRSSSPQSPDRNASERLVSVPDVQAKKQTPPPVATKIIADDQSLKEHAALRAGLPPLKEGDQFAITEFDPAVLAKSESVSERSGLAVHEGDMTKIGPMSSGISGREALNTQLPPDVATAIQSSAEKLNEGLSGEK